MRPVEVRDVLHLRVKRVASMRLDPSRRRVDGWVAALTPPPCG
jgi:hypothetical protein